jgi:multiple sugar transport system substrate-binding protein
MRKVLTVALVLVMAAASAFAAGKRDAGPGTRVVTTTCRASYANEKWFKDMNAAFTAESGIAVDVQPTPGNDDFEHMTKVNLDLVAGGSIDVIETLGLRDQQGRIEAGFFMPLNGLLKEAGIDAAGIWGKFINYQKDGAFYDLPFKQEVRCVFFNKDMFDRAGIPYPKGPWTWDEYIATAKKLTDLSKNQYGSLMANGTPNSFILARQKDIPFYKADGTSNFDDPAFAECLQWYYDIGHKNKVQLSVGDLIAMNASWNYWVMTDNIAMFFQGNWFIRLLNSPEDYPRAWRYGVAPCPGAGPNGNNTVGSVGYVSINKNAAHPKEALEYAVWIARNQWKFENGLPALEKISPADQELVFGPMVEASDGQIVVEELYSALIDTGMGNVPLNIIGPAATEYNNIVNEEVERFCMDQQDLRATIRRVVSRANEAIVNSR